MVWLDEEPRERLMGLSSVVVSSCDARGRFFGFGAAGSYETNLIFAG